MSQWNRFKFQQNTKTLAEHTSCEEHQNELSMLLSKLVRLEQLRELDKVFALFIVESEGNSGLNQEERVCLSMLAAHLSFQLGRQHSCIELDELGQPYAPHYFFKPQLIKAVLAGARSIGANKNSVSDSSPMVIEFNRLYLQKYWFYEQNIAQRINGFCRCNDAPNMEQIAHLLSVLYSQDVEGDSKIEEYSSVEDSLPVEDSPPVEDAIEVDWQKLAVINACLRSFTVVTGGPGTGKTTTVAKILWMLRELNGASSGLNIKLLAPTGKAAARLAESLALAKSTLPARTTRGGEDNIECATIHRALGVIPGSANFKRNKTDPISADVIIVDEASMIDLPMLSKLLDAVPDKCRFIVLGDPNQLASVDVGSVLADICGFIDMSYSPAFMQQIAHFWSCEQLHVLGKRFLQDNQAGSIVRDHFVHLRKSFRFRDDSMIGKLAKACNNGDRHSAFQVLNSKGPGDTVFWQTEVTPTELCSNLANRYLNYFDAIKEQNIAQAFSELKQLQLLTVLRNGQWGSVGLNLALELEFEKRDWITRAGEHYSGRAIMVMQNSYPQQLYNGDIGIAIRDSDGVTKIWFEDEGDSFRALLPAQVPAHETIFAMTTHKSQGSEFEHVVMCLPDKLSNTSRQLLTREILYTGITRAKKSFRLIGSEGVISYALQNRCTRASGLMCRL